MECFGNRLLVLESRDMDVGGATHCVSRERRGVWTDLVNFADRILFSFELGHYEGHSIRISPKQRRLVGPRLVFLNPVDLLLGQYVGHFLGSCFC